MLRELWIQALCFFLGHKYRHVRSDRSIGCAVYRCRCGETLYLDDM